MKKLGIILLVVAAAVLLLFAPLATGMLTQSNLEQRIAAIDENPSLTAAVTSYERGWFSSHVELEVGFSGEYLDQLEDLEDIELTNLPIVIDVYHGPVSFADGFHLGMTRIVARPDPDWSPAEFATTQLGMPYLFEFRGQSGFGRRFDFDADVPPIDYAGDLGEVTFAGFTLTGSSTAAGGSGELTVEGGTDGASYQNPFAAASIGSIRFRADYQFVPDDVPLSHGELEIERVVATSPMLGATPLFEASGVSVSGSLSRAATGDRLEADARYAADSLAAGEGLSFTDAEMVLTLVDIDGAAARDYYAIVSELGASGTPADAQALLGQLFPVLDRLLEAGPSLVLDPFHFSMPEGRFEAAVTATVDASGLPAGQPADLRNMATLFGALSVEASARVAKPLAQRLAVAAMRTQLAMSDAGGENPTPEELGVMAEAQAGFVLVGLVGQGLLQDTGDDYTTTIEFRNGALTVNGAPMPLGLL